MSAAPIASSLIGPITSSRKLSEYTLVVRSLGVEHGVSARDEGYYFVVPERAGARVRDAINAYEAENRDWPPRPAPRERLPFRGSRALPVIYAGLLSLLFLLTGPVAARSTATSVGVASSDRILHGEVWRAVTALTLHADAAHLVGNIAVGSAFLWVASHRIGPGRAALLTLLGGAVGNYANAILHGPGHNSLGASTAVFATVGVLIVTQTWSNVIRGARRWTDWAGPWVGGAALLGALGASAQSDLWAHLLGLVAGVGLGFLFARAPRRPGVPKPWAQPVLGLVTLATIAAAWSLAFNVRLA